MNRRNFIGTASAFVLGCALGLHCKLEEITKKVVEPTKTIRVVLNPEYFKAPYEVGFIYNKNGLTTFEFDRRNPDYVPEVFRTPDGNTKWMKESYPIRKDENGIVVSPFIEV
jgi:hypothetical protein